MLELAAPDWLAAFCLGLALEAAFGEPRRCHPLVGFGWLANLLEHQLNRGGQRFWRGVLAWLLLLAGVIAAFLLLRRWLGWIADGVALWFALGARSLDRHAQAIIAPLRQGDLAAAREQVSRIVSRDCSALDADGVSTAALESVLENGADAIFASLFWFALLGGSGALLQRLANTLDAMWGYRTAQFLRFGRLAARADDFLNWLPARLTAASYALLGNTRSALTCWRRQASNWDSPNAGPVMASGAGALSVRLGGPARYHGQWENRPTLGHGHRPGAADIQRGVLLVRATLALWLLLLIAVGGWRWLS